MANQGNVPGLGMGGLASHLGAERVEHAAAADHVRVAVEAANAVQAHREVAGDVEPGRYLLLLAWRGVALGELLQVALGADEAEEVGLEYLVGGVDVVELSLLEAAEDKPLVVFVAGQFQLRAPFAGRLPVYR